MSMIIRKDTSVGRELLHCLMAGRPNKSQSVGQSLICCLRAGGGSTFLQVFSTGPSGDPTKHHPTTCFILNLRAMSSEGSFISEPREYFPVSMLQLYPDAAGRATGHKITGWGFCVLIT